MKSIRNIMMIVCGIIIGVGISYSSDIYAAAKELIGKVNVTDKMVEVYKENGNSLQIYSQNDKLSPVIKWETNGKKSYIFYDPEDNTFSVTSNDANVKIDSGGRLDLFGAKGTYVQNWGQFKNNTTGESLQQELDNKVDANSKTGAAGAANGGIPIGTKLVTADGKTVTWMGVPKHTHTNE